MEDAYGIERKTCPCVRFTDMPRDMATEICAMVRAVGWISQCLDMMVESDQRIGHPQQIYEPRIPS